MAETAIQFFDESLLRLLERRRLGRSPHARNSSSARGGFACWRSLRLQRARCVYGERKRHRGTGLQCLTGDHRKRNESI
jgi:hypothetical protein